MSQPSSPAGSTSIHDLADRIGVYRALDLLLWESVGGWITEVSASFRPVVAATSQHHGWHAELWEQRFPVVPGLDVHEATRRAASLLEPVRRAVAGTDDDAGRAAWLADVLRQLLDVTEAHRARVDPLVDAPTARVLDLVVDDLARDVERTAACATDLGAAPHGGAGVDLRAALDIRA